MRALLHLLKGSYYLLIFTLISSLFTGVFSTLIIKEIHVALTEPNEFNATYFAIYFFSMIVGYLIASVITSISIAEINRRMIHRLRIVLSQKVLSAPYERVEGMKSNILPILTDDLNHIANLVNRLPSVTTGLATVLGILVYLFWLSPLMGFLTLGAFLLVYVSNLSNLRMIGKYSNLNREHYNVIYKLIEGLVYGIANLMLHKRFKKRYVEEKLNENSEIQMKWYFREMIYNSINNRLNDVVLLAFLGGIILLVYVYHIVTVSFFNTYLTLILFMLGPIATVSGFFGIIKHIKASLIQIEKLGIKLDDQTAPGFSAGTMAEVNSHELKGKLNPEFDTPLIEIRGLNFTYQNSRDGFCLKDINLSMHEGSRLFIEGGNGSGKSTLIKLICGLYKPTSGKVLYRGEEVTDQNLDNYRDCFAVVLTDSYLFDDLRHMEAKQLAQAEGYLKMLEMDHKVSLIDGVFSTIDLSEGQKKRLQLVHMLMEDKEVYIFDEWVAYQDRHSKQLFYTQVLPFLKDRGKVVINIAHDYSYENLADEIILMEDGNIVQEKH